MFTVKNIKHTLKSENIIYQYSCEDTFSYQHIRQHNGYSIENDPSSEDFIGAKTIDWWVHNKIKKDCHISYEYVPLFEGLYQAQETNNLILYNDNSSPTNVLKIVKQIYTKEEYPELYEKIPFSISGSNASAVLISLAEELGLMLNYREQNIRDRNGNRTNLFKRYFWFEPKKNEKTANLKYSPKINIQSFDFSHNGAALTTILNVDPVEVNNELVTLIPETPPLFSSLFLSSDWNNSSYTDGYFTSICQEKVFFCEGGLSAENTFGYSLDLVFGYEKGKSFYTENYIYLILKDNNNQTLKIPNYYNRVSLFNDKKETSLFINDKYYSVKNSKINFVIRNENGEDVVYNSSFNLLPSEFLGTDQTCYVRIAVPLTTKPLIRDSKILLSFTRDATIEELEFAKAADLCPWLENKLIDFSYFLKQGILSPIEYKTLLNTFKNDLRIINGKLLYYSKEYYHAIQIKTKQLAEITTTLDSLGAAFNSDIIEPFKTLGRITDISYFREAYRNYQTKLKKEAVTTPILNYNALLTEYFNKYFKAQQRFLKNIYYFRQYFNQKIQWGENVKVVQKTLTFKTIGDFIIEENEQHQLTPKIYANEVIEKIDENNYLRRYISFNKKPYFSSISNQNFKPNDALESPVKIYLNDKITEATLVTKKNYTNFLVETPKIQEEMIRCGKNDEYNENKTYYRVGYKCSLVAQPIENWEKDIVDIEGNHWYQHHYDNESVWYCSAAPDALWETWPEEINCYINKEAETTEVLNKDYIPISYKRIINDYIYKNIYSNNQIGWQIHDADTNVKVSENWWNDTKIKNQLKLFLPTVFGNTFSPEEWSGVTFKQLIQEIKTFLTSYDSSNGQGEKVDFYKSHFPITSVTYTGPHYTKNEYTFNNKKYDYQPANKKNQTYTDYVNYLKEVEIYHNENVTEVANPFNKDQYVSHSIPIASADTESKYFRRVPKTGAVVAIGVPVALSGIWTTAFTVGTGGLGLNAFVSWATAQAIWHADTKWETSGINTKNFFNKKFSNNINYTGYHDSSEVFYTNSASSYNDWKAINKQREENETEVSAVKVSKESSLTGWIQIGSYTDMSETYYMYCQTKSFSNDIKYDYFDYYSKIVFTYSSAINANPKRGTITYQDSYLRFVSPRELIGKKNKYKVLLLENEDGQDIIFVDRNSISNNDLEIENNRLSRILYYFIDNNCSEVDLYDIDILKTPTWEDYFPSNFDYDEINHIYTVYTSEGKKISFILFQQEDFNRKVLYTSAHWESNRIREEYRYSLYNSKTIYDSDDIEIEFNKKNDLVEGFFYIPEEKTDYMSAENVEIVWETKGEVESTKFFKETEKGYERVYTILQMIDMGNFYYIKNDTYEENTLDNIYEFTTQVYLHQEKYTKKDNEWFLDTDIANTFIKEAYHKFNFKVNNPYTIYIEDINGLEYSRTCELNSTEGTPIGNITNGHFWYLYHSATNLPLLFETAAAIETELTKYWEQAYSASLYCEYFLPSSWQAQTDGDVNHFNKNIIVFTTDSNDSTKTIPVLSNKYLPEVSIYNNGNTSKLPLYELEYGLNYDSSYSILYLYHFI